MSDWDRWDKLLGPGHETESSGGSGSDGKGHQGTIVIRRRINKQRSGRAIFEVFLEGKPAGFAPAQAEVVSLEVEGFAGLECSERKICAQFGQLPPNAGLLKLVPGSKFTFEPAGHDGGVLSGLLAKCDCAKEGVKSYKIYVEVEFTPPVPAVKIRFSICYPCGRIEL